MEDKEAIRQVALDYIEGWYQGDATRMERALYAKLIKRRLTPDSEVWQVDKDWMVDATGQGRGRIENPEKGRREVTILDMTDRMSCVRVVSEKFVDYLHLAKDAETWVIVNVLWDYLAA